MNSKTFIICIALFFVLLVQMPLAALAENDDVHPADLLVGETLAYDVSFLWFDRLAAGSIHLEKGQQPGTYLAVMEARTRGVAAFVTKNRIERYQTLMEVGPDGFLRPLVHSSHTFKGTGKKQREKKTIYTFDYANRQVQYKKIKNHIIHADEMLPLESEGPVFDILSAFYNLRLEAFGALDQQAIHLPTFHRKGVEEIVVTPMTQISEKDRKFFASGGTLCKVLVDPSIFKTNGRELFVSFDKNNRLERGIIKNVIGLGDVKGVLRQVTTLAQVTN